MGSSLVHFMEDYFFPSVIYMNLNLVVFLFLLNSFCAVSLFLLSPVFAVWFLKWILFSFNPVWPCWASRLTQKADWEQHFPWLSSLSQITLPIEKVEHSSSLRLCSSYLINYQRRVPQCLDKTWEWKYQIVEHKTKQVNSRFGGYRSRVNMLA